MKANEIRDLTKEESEQKIVDLRLDIAKERALLASGTRPENPGKIRHLRRTIAKILTVLNEKKTGEVKENK